MKNPERIKETWLDRIQKKRQSKEMARRFFHTYVTQEEITKQVYPKAYRIRKKKNRKNFVMPLISKRVKEWKSYGFFDKSVPIKKEVFRYGKKHKQTFYLSLMNLGPIYKFCKENGIELLEKEKEFLERILLSDHIRKEILDKFPKEDIINATLKYYAKNTIMRYFYLLREIRENPKRYKKEIKKVEKINKSKSKTRKEFDLIKTLAYFSNVTPSQILFRSYLRDLEKNREMILSVDEKILKALGTYPDTIGLGKKPDKTSIK